MSRRQDSVDMMTNGSRLSRQVAKRVVREFKGSYSADLWRVLRDPEPVIDNLVLRQIRYADIGDSALTFSPREIMEFRQMLVEELATKGYQS